MKFFKWIILCLSLYAVKLVGASAINGNAPYVSAVNDERSDTLYLNNGTFVVGDYDYETKGKIVIYHPESNDRTKIAKEDADRLVLADGKVIKYEPKQKKKLTPLGIFGVVVASLLGLAVLYVGGLILLIYLLYP